MMSVFVVIRFIFLSILIYLNLIALVFASWSAHSFAAAKVSLPGSVVLLLFNTCVLFFAIFMSLATIIFPGFQLGTLRIECLWAGVMSVMQTAAAVGLTVEGPSDICRVSSIPWALCASSSLLVYIAWLIALILLAYFFTILVMTLVHARFYPTIWSMTVHSVPWFTPPPPTPSSSHRSEFFVRNPFASNSTSSLEKRLPSTPAKEGEEEYLKSRTMSSYANEPALDLWAKAIELCESEDSLHGQLRGEQLKQKQREQPQGQEMQKEGKSKQQRQTRFTFKPSWSKDFIVRRGVDAPFTVGKPSASFSSASPNQATPPLRLPKLVSPPDARVESGRLGSGQGSRHLGNVLRAQGEDVHRLTLNDPSVGDMGFDFADHYRYGAEGMSEGGRAGGQGEFGFLVGVPKASLTLDEFPGGVEDPDSPLPLPRLSEWIRADAKCT